MLQKRPIKLWNPLLFENTNGNCYPVSKFLTFLESHALRDRCLSWRDLEQMVRDTHGNPKKSQSLFQRERSLSPWPLQKEFPGKSHWNSEKRITVEPSEGSRWWGASGKSQARSNSHPSYRLTYRPSTSLGLSLPICNRRHFRQDKM